MSAKNKSFAFAVLFFLMQQSGAALVVKILPPTGEQPVVIRPQGSRANLYSASAALVISVSDYRAGASGWTKLENTGPELDKVAEELRNQGFEVTRVYDPSSTDLKKVMDDFIAKYGGRKDIRVLLFFSGHGYTSDTNQMSYVVPADGLNPKTDYAGFLGRAMALEAFHTWVRQFSANHVLAIFDTCFSGSIFTTKSAQDVPKSRPLVPADRWRYLTDSVNKPVRQFIAAGGAKEELPSTSTFVPVFIEAMRGAATSVEDGFVTGKEIGVFVERVVSERRNGSQNPISGVSRDANFIFGDIIFQFDRTKANREVGILSPPITQRPVEIAPRESAKVPTPIAPSIKGKKEQKCFNFNNQMYCE